MADSTSKSCDRVLIFGCISYYGVPTTATSDHSWQYLSELWQDLLNLFGINPLHKHPAISKPMVWLRAALETLSCTEILTNQQLLEWPASHCTSPCMRIAFTNSTNLSSMDPANVITISQCVIPDDIIAAQSPGLQHHCSLARQQG